MGLKLNGLIKTEFERGWKRVKSDKKSIFEKRMNFLVQIFIKLEQNFFFFLNQLSEKS